MKIWSDQFKSNRIEFDCIKSSRLYQKVLLLKYLKANWMARRQRNLKHLAASARARCTLFGEKVTFFSKKKKKKKTSLFLFAWKKERRLNSGFGRAGKQNMCAQTCEINEPKQKLRFVSTKWNIESTKAIWILFFSLLCTRPLPKTKNQEPKTQKCTPKAI